MRARRNSRPTTRQPVRVVQPASLVAGVAWFAAGGALAQAVPPPDPLPTQTVTVSGTRRAEVVRDVPVSLTRLSADALQASGAKDLADALSGVPGVSYNQSLGRPGNGELVMRGVTTGLLTNATVAVYIDDVPVGSTSGQNRGTSAFDQRLLDLQGIELLKGPQGTLYGASAMGGLLKYNTRQPDAGGFAAQFGGDASRTSSGGTGTTVYGNVNAPLSAGVAALRAAVFHASDGGYTDATGPAAGKDVNSGKVTGARLALGVTPSKALDLRFTLQSQDARYDGLGVTSVDASGQPIAGELTQAGLRYAQPSRQRADLATVNVEWDLGWAKAYSITGHQRQRDSETSDLNDGFLALFPPFFAITQIDMSSRTSLDKTTQEFRLVSSSGGSFEWIAGLFHSREKSAGASRWIAATGAGSIFPNPAPLLDDAGIATRWRETAAYGTVVWNATPALALTAGVRAARNTLDVTTINSGLIAIPNGVSTTSTDASPTTYLLAARYRLSASTSAYARVASGYRAGGPNPALIDPATGIPIATRPYKSDSLWSYEAGVKSEFGNRASIEAALFRVDWKDLQVQIASTGAATLGNAGRARVQGFEFGGTWRPTEATTLRAAATLLDAGLVDASPELGGRAGERLPTAPRTAFSLQARQALSLGGKPGFVAASLARTGDRTTSFDGNPGAPNYRLPAYTTLDVNAGMSLAGFDLGVYVRNLADARGQISAYTQFAGLGLPSWVTTIRPRTMGLTASRAF